VGNFCLYDLAEGIFTTDNTAHSKHIFTESSAVL